MIDLFGRDISYLRLSVTDLCNLRCRYCMPEEGICKKRHEEMLTEDEMITAVRAAAALGIRKLRITGGEPLVKKNILSICRRAKAVPGIQELCLTTNATLLRDLARPLKEAGVDRLNISLDTLDPERYHAITRTGSFGDAWAGIEGALQAGFDRIKLNTVLLGGFNDDEIPALAELTWQYPLDLRFIELMPMPGNEHHLGTFLPCSAVTAALPELQDLEQTQGVARLYSLPNAKGHIGLISPLSQHFCAECTRLRITADGKVKPCLLTSTELNLKGLRQADMETVLKNAILQKPQCHPAQLNQRPGRAMVGIGG